MLIEIIIKCETRKVPLLILELPPHKSSYNQKTNPYVKSVNTQDDYCLLLIFENGGKRIFDLKPYMDKPVFKRLTNIALFKTARVVSGPGEWQGEVDLSYHTLYLESKLAKETRSRRKTKRGQKEGLAVAGITKKKSPKVRISAN